MGKRDMLGLLDELLNALRAEAALYRDLLAMMDRERTALVRSRRMELEACAAEKSALIERLTTVEHRRAEVVQRLARHLGRPAVEVTLRRLALISPEPQGSVLRQVRAELLGLMARVNEENRRSAQLCRHIGELLRAAYGMVKGLAANGVVYHRGGRLERARLHGKLVRDEI